MYLFTHGAQPQYVPTAGDEAYGAATGFPAHYNMFVQGNGSAAPGVGRNIVDYRADKCALWQGLVPDVRPFWWCN